MRAIVRYQGLPPSDPRSLVEARVPAPVTAGRDVLVRVEAVSVTSVDVRARTHRLPTPEGLILGGEGSGTVVAVGPDVTRFKAGDRVWWVGEVNRPGSNADYQLVDERNVGLKPVTLSWAEAAAMPMTAITAWEALFDRLHLTGTSTGTILMVGASGGVGSIMIQLARTLLPLVRTIATASSDQEAAWVSALGTDAIVDSRLGLVEQVDNAAPDGIDWIFTPHARGLSDANATVLKPFGNERARRRRGTPGVAPQVTARVAWHWELMFTRPLERIPDGVARQDVLDKVAALVDAGRLRTTMATHLTGFDARTLRTAHALVEKGPAIGKVVVAR
ncbi:zinc-binding alcohol dehydrogenase family protein [Dactylosporangium sp. CA-092794]|uniref:zinc-binding alcohol dehydrogenase family protein n=1 Tax=Dactylosporangium sp. CA-092794 TaxID=3239929 RepID=UPI003D8ED16F